MPEAKRRMPTRLLRWSGLVALAGAAISAIMGAENAQLVFALSFGSLVFLVLCLVGFAEALRNLRLQVAGYVADATVVAHRECKERWETEYVPIVSFVTRDGEPRPSVALHEGTEEAWPRLGTVIPIVYDPQDAGWVDRRRGWWWFGLAAVVGLMALAVGVILAYGVLSFLFGHIASWFSQP